jgi:hypothetical protein
MPLTIDSQLVGRERNKIGRNRPEGKREEKYRRRAEK